MSMQQQREIEDLKRRVGALEELVANHFNDDDDDHVLQPVPPAVSGDPPLHKTGTLRLPWKSKSA